MRNVMNRNPLKITVGGEADVKLYPEADEPVNILNIKRGIVSALMVPLVEGEMTKNMVSTLTPIPPTIKLSFSEIQVVNFNSGMWACLCWNTGRKDKHVAQPRDKLCIDSCGSKSPKS